MMEIVAKEDIAQTMDKTCDFIREHAAVIRRHSDVPAEARARSCLRAAIALLGQEMTDSEMDDLIDRLVHRLVEAIQEELAARVFDD